MSVALALLIRGTKLISGTFTETDFYGSVASCNRGWHVTRRLYDFYDFSSQAHTHVGTIDGNGYYTKLEGSQDGYSSQGG